LPYTDGEVVWTASSADGKSHMDIIQRPDGICRFTAATLHPGDDYSRGPYWQPTHHSGLYLDVASAKADALATLDWLKS
jgi:hypothetical protein